MKVALLATLLLLGSAVQGRKLLQDGCSDLSILATVPDVSDIGTIIEGFGLLPNGVPSNATIFLPNNEAVAALIGLVANIVPGITPENLPSLVQTLPPALGVPGKLVSALLYHIVPAGALTPEQLLELGDVPTALDGYTLQFGETSVGNYTITTGSGEVASTGEPLSACGSNIYIVDKVLTPAQLLDPTFPETTLAEALAILGQEGGAAPAPAPEATA